MTIKECTKEDLLDIIKSKDAEIEQLKRDLGQCENLYKQQMHYLQYQLGEAKMEVERLEETNRILRKEIKTMHDKASKKMEKYRLKELLKGKSIATEADIDYVVNHLLASGVTVGSSKPKKGLSV